MSLDPDILRVVSDVVYYVVFHFTKAVLAVNQRDSYLYWPFLISTLAIVVLASRFAARAIAQQESAPGPGFFSARLWWHSSARADYRLYFANALLFPLIVAPFLFSDATFAALIDSALGQQGPVAGPESASAGMAARLIFTVVFFIAYDFGRFVAHSLLHDIPVLWEFHKVHHSAEVLTPLTAYRVHPVELALMAWVPALTTGIVVWAFNRFAHGAVSFYSFLGLHVAIWAFNLIDNLRHSPVWISYGPAWGRWLVSPAHHQLHHSREPQHWGRNRGSNLAIWDRLYGTLYVPPVRAETFQLGLGDETDGRWNSVGRMYFWPVAGAMRRISDLLRGRSAPRES